MNRPLLWVVLLGILVAVSGGGLYWRYTMRECSAVDAQKLTEVMDNLDRAKAVYMLTGDTSSLNAEAKELYQNVFQKMPHRCLTILQRGQSKGACPTWAQQQLAQIQTASPQAAIRLASTDAGVDQFVSLTQETDRALARLPNECLAEVEQANPTLNSSTCAWLWKSYRECARLESQRKTGGTFSQGYCVKPNCPE